jgi:hypothetical protein
VFIAVITITQLLVYFTLPYISHLPFIPTLYLLTSTLTIIYLNYRYIPTQLTHGKDHLELRPAVNNRLGHVRQSLQSHAPPHQIIIRGKGHPYHKIPIKPQTLRMHRQLNQHPVKDRVEPAHHPLRGDAQNAQQLLLHL